MTEPEEYTPKEKEEGTLIDTMSFEGRVDEDYVPEGFDSVEDFLQDMRDEYQADLDFDHDNREEALDDKKFSAGEQWDEQVLEERKGLPCLVINTIPQFTAQLVGDWRESRKAIKGVASNDEDAGTQSDYYRFVSSRRVVGRSVGGGDPGRPNPRY